MVVRIAIAIKLLTRRGVRATTVIVPLAPERLGAAVIARAVDDHSGVAGAAPEATDQALGAVGALAADTLALLAGAAACAGD